MCGVKEVRCPYRDKMVLGGDRFCRQRGERLPAVQVAAASEENPREFKYWSFSWGKAFPRKYVLAIYLALLIASMFFNGYQYLRYQEVQSDVSSLKSRYENLWQSYETLMSYYEKLLSKYDTLESNVKKTYMWVDEISNETTLRIGMRPKELVTPDDPSVAEAVLSCTGGWTDTSDWNEYWTDLSRMYGWVRANVGYSYDSPILVIYNRGSSDWRAEYWRYPRETIADKHGDCEDQALLLCSMIRNYNRKMYDAWVVLANEHAAVILPSKGGQLTILDPTTGFFTKTALWQLTSKPANVALQEWAEDCKKTIPNLKVRKIFNEEVERSFFGNEQFLSWLLENYP